MTASKQNVAPFAIMTSDLDPQIWMQTDAKAGVTITIKKAKGDGTLEDYGIFKTGEDLKQGQALWTHGGQFVKTYPPSKPHHQHLIHKPLPTPEPSLIMWGENWTTAGLAEAKKASDVLGQVQKEFQEALAIEHLLGIKPQIASAAKAKNEVEKTIPWVEEFPTMYDKSLQQSFVSGMKSGKTNFSQQYFNELINQDPPTPLLSSNESIIRDEFVKVLSYITYIMANGSAEIMDRRYHTISTHRNEQSRSTIINFDFEIKDHEIPNLRGHGELNWDIIEEILRKRKVREDRRIVKAEKEKVARPKHRKIIIK